MIFQDRFNSPNVNKEFSVLLMQRLPVEAAGAIVSYYSGLAEKKDPEKEHQFSFAMYKILESGTLRFSRLALFAYDPEGLFVKNRRFEPERTRVLEEDDFLWSAESIAKAVTNYVQDTVKDTPFAYFAREEFDKISSICVVEDILKRLK